MIKPTISLCIPTYNRAKYLKKSIDSVICQPEFQNGEVEIVISDNASTDGTEKLGKTYESEYENIKYFKNSKNIVVENYPLSLRRGCGMYRKLCNDTFVYREDSMRNLCDFIKFHVKDKKTLFFLNQMRKNVKKEIIECHDFNEFAETACTWTTWIGGFGLWEDECDKITSDLTGCDSLLWQCAQIYKIVAEKKETVINNQKLYEGQTVENKNLTYGLYQVLYVYFVDILKKYLSIGLLKKETFDKICYEQLNVFFTNIIISMELNHFSGKLSADENLITLKKLVFAEIKSRYNWKKYYSNYKKRKAITVTKMRIKKALRYLHIWDIIVALHIKDH